MSQAHANELTRPRAGGGAGEDDALTSLAPRLSDARSLDEIMALSTHGVRTLVGADGATFVLKDGDRCFYADEDAISPLWKGRRFPLSACISGWCMTHRQAVALADIYTDPRIPADAYRPTFVRSLAMAPVGQDEAVAALGAYWAERREIRPAELDALQAIADAAALALARLRRQAGAPEPRRAAPRAVAKASAPSRREADPRPSLGNLVERVFRQGLRAGSPQAYALAGVCVAVATLLRLGVQASGVHGLAIFSAYYPAVLLATLAAGRGAGLLAAVLGGLAAYYFFMPPLYVSLPLDASDLLNLALYAGASGLIILIIDSYQRAVARLRQEDARHLILAREQHHRVRNALAVVEAIVHQSLRGEPSQARIIIQRLRSGLSEVDLGDRAAEQPGSLRELLTAELAPYDLVRFTLEGGDDTPVPAEARRLLSLAAHELATNAVKYGALSAPDGRVTVAWRTLEDQASITWREAGGPPVQPPQKRGYGSILLRRLLEAAKGSLSLHFEPTGLCAEISLPLSPPRRGG